jgi:nicotinate-nucleotide--dimethylbenzimidazole phosphoribosyltransferase
MNSDSFEISEKRGLYRAIFERKDIRTYKPDAISADVLERILDGAHHAPSVGFMQPWNFILIESPEKKRLVYNHFLDVNESSAKLFPGERNVKYRSLKLQGILDSPLNILVTCDTKRGGENVLGRTTIPQTDIYSTCLSIQNLWLCARAEGIGIGWMSLYIPEVISNIFSLPDYVIPVAYLTAGYAVEFPETPILESVGWRKRLPLDDVLFFNQWGKNSSGFMNDISSDSADFDGNNLLFNLASITNDNFHQTASNPGLIDTANHHFPLNGKNVSHNCVSAVEFQKRNDNLTKPPGSLGKFEGLMEKICSIQQSVYPQSDIKRIVIAASDHGIVEEGVSAYQKELTSKMVYQFLAGGGAISSLARQYGIGLYVVDAGVDHDFENASGLIDCKIRRSTRNMTREPAMSKEECDLAIARGIEFVQKLGQTDILGLGEMGIGNSTSASAMASALLRLSPEEVTGLGTGVGPSTLIKKTEIIQKALEFHGYSVSIDKVTPENANEILRIFGGYEIAFLVGVIYGANQHTDVNGAVKKIPVVLDGFITSVAALVAVINQPEIIDILIAGHLSKEPGHRLVLDRLGLAPVIDMNMSLGEGSGAAFAIGLLDGSIRIMRELKTFEEAGIENPVNLPARF